MKRHAWQGVTALLFVSSLFFLPVFAEETSPFTPLNETSEYFLETEGDELNQSNTGAFTYTYPITIPKGRFGLQPNLDVYYNHQDQQQDSIFGFGWSMDFPMIRRLNKTGTEKLYTDHYFTSSLSGELVPVSLTDGVHGTYTARIENGDFLIYTYRAEGYWTITDKLGTMYTLGDTNDSMQNDPTDLSRVYAWMIREVRDTNNNYIRYEYTEENGKIYPAKINYTGNGVNDGSFSVYFYFEARSDALTSYDTGFLVKTEKRVRQMVVRENEIDIRHFDFAYTVGHNSTRSLLASITETGFAANGNATTFPPTTFRYNDSEKTWTEDLNYSLPVFFKTYNSRYNNVRQADVNGDGLVDLIQAYQKNTDGYGGFDSFTHVFLNKGNRTGWEEVPWSFPEHCESNTCNLVRYIYHNGRDDPDPEVIENPYAEFTPVVFNDYNGYDTGARLVDINGDGLTDLLESYTIDIQEQHYYPRLGGAAWEEQACTDDPLETPHCYTEEYSSHTEDRQAVYMNNGSGWMKDDNYVVPVSAIDYQNYGDQGMRFADVNGDGLVDLLHGRDDYYDNGVRAVYLNKGDGTGWELDSDFELPVSFTLFGGSYDGGVRLADVNRDGLMDIVKVLAGYNEEENDSVVYLNKGDGTGWQEDINYSIPMVYHTDEGRESEMGFGYLDWGLRFMDVNADGLVDLIYAREEQEGYDTVLVHTVFVNTGNNFVEDSSYRLPNITDAEYVNQYSDPMLYFAGRYANDTGVRMADVNGDGAEDFMFSYDGVHDWYGENYDVQEVYTHDATIPDILNTITSSYGSTTSVTYQSSAVYKDEAGNLSSPSLPYTVQTVRSVQTDDGFGNLSTSTYDYTDGRMYYENPFEKRFAGFHEVNETNDLGFIRKRYYHQGNDTNTAQGEYLDHFSKIGKKYREEIYNNAGGLMQTVVQRWEDTDFGSENYFVRNTITTQLDYDGNNDHKDSATEWTYDTSNGNLLQRITRGEVTANEDGTYIDTGQDAFTISWEYASSADELLRSYVAREWMKDQANKTMRETRTYYDNENFGVVAQGNKTKEERLISDTQYAITTYTHMADIGLIDSITDPNGNRTLYWYDNYVLYPTVITDALGYIMEYTYDYSSGQPARITNSNGGIAQKAYDGLDRVIQEEQSDVNDPALLVITKTIEYVDNEFPRSIYESNWLNDETKSEHYTYYNGLSRPVQERVELNEGGEFSVKDQGYNALGLVDRVSLPYSSFGDQYTSPTNDEWLYERYTYDALQREVERANSVGVTGTDHDNWKKTVVDPNDHSKEYQYDAYDRNASVKEFIAGAPYTTSYSYDANNNLIKLTDASGNVRKFTYDFLNRQLTAQDLHSPLDTQFSAWTYRYDVAGNKTSVTDGNGITSSYRYDALHRLVSENDSTTAGVDIVYAYDNCAYGVGQLCSATVKDIVKTDYTYTPTGDQAFEQRTIDGIAYFTSFEYDRQHHISAIIYPDESRVHYQYNSAGKISEVVFTDTDGTTTNVASSITYAPSFKPTTLTTGNGAAMNWQYDSNQLYRLAQKQTTVAGATVQDFSYQYDPNGNITSIDDQSSVYDSIQLSYSYDDFDRLTAAQAISSDPVLEYTETYAYDAIGNIAETSTNGAYQYQSRRAGNYGNPQAATKVGTTTYGYDQNGNMTGRGRWVHAWNFKNQLTSSTKGDQVIQYGYDHTGARVVKEVVGESSVITLNPYYEIENNFVRRHIPLDDMRFGILATSTHNELSGTTSTIYHATDHLGGTHLELNDTGVVEEYLLYRPYGSILSVYQANAYDNPYKFTGQKLDDETDLYYFNARYYDPSIGRFMTVDPNTFKIGLSSQKFTSDYPVKEGNRLDVYEKKQKEEDWRVDVRNNIKIESWSRPLQLDPNQAFGRDEKQGFVLEKEQNKAHEITDRYTVEPQRFNAYAYALNNPIQYIDSTGNEADRPTLLMTLGAVLGITSVAAVAVAAAPEIAVGTAIAGGYFFLKGFFMSYQ